MIVQLTFPSNISRVSYGAGTMLLNLDHTLQVPDYVGKTLLGLPGVTGPSITDNETTLLATAAEREALYLFVAYDRTAPEADRVAAALTLLADRGIPTVSAT